MEIEHQDITERTKKWRNCLLGRAAYVAGLGNDTENVDEKLWMEVVNQLNVTRAGLDRQQRGIIMQREALDKVTL